MKKIISIIISSVLVLSMSIIALATDVVQPLRESKGLAEYDIMPMSTLYTKNFTLSANSKFTSYQYQVNSNPIEVGAVVTSSDSNANIKLSLYGSNSVGGSKKLVKSATLKGAGSKTIYTTSNFYKYYNIVIQNLGSSSVSGTADLYAD